MKKIILPLLLSALSFSLVGCEKNETLYTYPQIEIRQTMWDCDSIKIGIGEQYAVKDYDKEYTDDGIEVVIYFEKVEK